MDGLPLNGVTTMKHFLIVLLLLVTLGSTESIIDLIFTAIGA
jgi:hypothetical protein